MSVVYDLQALPLDTILTGDCLDVLRGLPDNSVDAIVTDPPAGISFMGKRWDSDHGGREQWVKAFAAIYRECLRVLKPGGHALVWALPRTSHWTATALEDAGFEIRDRVSHFFGSGFPKSLDVSKALDKQAGARGEEVWYDLYHDGKTRQRRRSTQHIPIAPIRNGNYHTKAATDAAREWDGWGTALKPAWEPIILARKPLVGTVAANAAAHGTGALRIDDCRIGTDGGHAGAGAGARVYSDGLNGPRGVPVSGMGRWPANVVLDEAAAAQLDAHSGHLHAAANKRSSPRRAYEATSYAPGTTGDRLDALVDHDGGGASRFFYTAKASRSERNDGIHGLPAKMPHDNAGHVHADGRAWDIPGSHSTPRANHHPTVKPVALMRWLVRLVTPEGGLVLDPFVGSGSTLVACRAEGLRGIGIDRELDYLKIAAGRLSQLSLFGGAA